MSHKCPVCGQDAPAVPLTIYRERCMVVHGGRFALLTGSEMGILHALAEVFPRVLSKGAAMDALYSTRPDQEPEAKIVDVFICKLRKKIEPLGIFIDTSWGNGYALRAETRPVLVEVPA